jgi:hypothetical protein
MFSHFSVYLLGAMRRDIPRKLIDIADIGTFALDLIDAPDMSDYR